MTETLGSKLVGELRQLLLVALYFYLCLLSLLLYASAVAGESAHCVRALRVRGREGVAAGQVRAPGHWLVSGTEIANRRVIYSVVYQVLALWALLVVLSLNRAVRRGFFPRAFDCGRCCGIAAGHLHPILAQSLILFLVLLPYVALRQLSGIMGPGKLRQVFLGTSS